MAASPSAAAPAAPLSLQCLRDREAAHRRLAAIAERTGGGRMAQEEATVAQIL
ncbi:MAG: hypothetical protein ACKOZW_13980 [Cyanobium sp.]